MSAAAAQAERAAAARSAATPRPVTRGESAQMAQVDWLHATWDGHIISREAVVGMLGAFMGRPVRALSASHGRFGFESRLDLLAGVGSSWVPVGCIAYGGEHQRGREMLQLTGGGCGLVKDWPSLAQLLEDLEATITRLDLAVDLLDGAITVDEAVEWYREERFGTGGRRPSCHVAGDWVGDGKEGRTFYVGRATNGKLLRVYEKGRQLGQADSPWVRFEVQFGSRDRVIPKRALVERDACFAGAYAVLETVLPVASERIETERTRGEISMADLLFWMRRSYGRVLHTAVEQFGFDPATLVEEVRIVGLPRRLAPSSAGAGVFAADVIAAMKGKR